MTTTQLRTVRHLGLNLSALETLLILAERGSITMTHLADDLGLTTASITKIADKLAKLQLVKRDPSIADRRVISLILTELGRLRIHQLTGRDLQPTP